MIADSAAMRISHPSASAIPAPAAGPGRAAIVGFRTAANAPVNVRCLVLRSATRSSRETSALLLLLPMPLTSPPAQKAVPVPVISSAPTDGSSPHCLIIRRSAGVRRSESALRASGRLSVMSATRSRISHNSSLVPVSISMRPPGIFNRSCFVLAQPVLNHEHLATWFGRIEQFALRRPMAQDGALIDVGLVGDLARRQRGRLLEQRKRADAIAASDAGIVDPQALLEKSDHPRITIQIA